MLGNLPSIWRPAVYHGFGREKGFFEGWYFKCVSADGQTRLAVIPGVSLAQDPKSSHAFIQLLDGARPRSDYFRFALSDFVSGRKHFDIRISRNRFGLDGMELDIDRPDCAIRGALRFLDIHPWPVRLFSPGAMGWYAFAPSMECYHGVLSFDHRLEGRLSVNGQETDFGGGKGYIEKDWGTSMPRAWVWMQSNRFEEEGVSLSLSIATVPWRKHWFTGALVGFWLQGKLYRFTTYTGARTTRFEVSDEDVSLTLEDRRHTLEVRAERAAGAPLASAVQGAMEGRLSETMDAFVEVSLSERAGSDRRLIFQGVGWYAGLEIVGDMGELKSGLGRR